MQDTAVEDNPLDTLPWKPFVSSCLQWWSFPAGFRSTGMNSSS